METVLKCFLAISEQGGEGITEENETILDDADDATLWRESEATYAGARDAEEANYLDDTDTYLYVGQYYWSLQYHIMRSCLFFDTSEIPLDAVITKVILKLYNAFDESDTDFNVVVQSGMPDYPHKPLVIGDYDRTYYSGNGGSVSTVGWAQGTFKEIEFTEQGRSWINKEGITKLILRSDRDINGTEPTGLEAVDIASQDWAEPFQRPTLYIEYEIEVVRQPTYASADCSLLVDDNDLGNFFGVRVPCELDVTRNVVGACVNTSQGIRVTITVNSEDVSDSLVGQIQVTHNLNYISTFIFSLGDAKYSPLVDPNIKVNAVVVITTYINGQEIKMFTGLVDETRTTYDGGYKLTITGRDYGKKLLDKTMTLISVQESADKAYRGSMVKYLAEQAGITNINVPTGDKVTIDHSFQDQNIWDMIQKECAIEGWQVRHDENGVMQVKTKALKTTPDWEYGEDKFVQLGLETSDRGIINKVTILGAIFEEEVITVNEIEVEPDEPTYEISSPHTSNSYSAGQITIGGWTDGDLSVAVQFVGYYLGFTYSQYRFTVSYSGSATIKSYSWGSSGGDVYSGDKTSSCVINRFVGVGSPAEAFSVSITIKLSTQTGGGIEELEEENPEETFTSTINYTQVGATVTDTGSILSLYGWGECKPENEGALEFPLAETVGQCKRIGENIILDSHRFIKQPDFRVPFNPKLIVGCTVKLTAKKIGYDEDSYLVEEAVHYIDIDKEGKIKARTRIGCVFYA